MSKKSWKLVASAAAVAAGALAALLVASPAEADAPGRSKPTGKPATTSTTVTGVVRYQGQPPARTAIDRGTDPACTATEVLSEKVVVTAGTLRDVHVRLAVGGAGTHAAPTEPVVIDQQACMYRPRVVGLVAGQKLVVRNSDPTYHNVRGTKHEHTEWNLGQPAQAPAITREDVGKPGEVITLRCDIHPWMRAYAVVTDHPYFAITGDDGAFALRDVPPGRYTLEAWHPELGIERTEITVAAGKPTQVEFTFP
ncbi:carboxypeptidase regulatory-like domain-containing protein [Haliangium sp.]|uniref:carboxypeptidase regulatory-like domain-containing protein n=1 Tax=Haliangium sp. TaxID=2663208 RepID=UPI003D0ABFF8